MATNDMGDSGDLKLSPLHAVHVGLGAKFAEFGGWSMPLEYTGSVKEHNAVRSACGIFDVSHLGKATVRGPGAAEFVNACFTNDLAAIEPGRAQYTLCCTDEGGVVDDLIAYLRGSDDVFLIPNASNTATVVDLLRAQAPDGIEIENLHLAYAVLAVQGPRSDDVVAAAGFPVGHPYMSFKEESSDSGTIVVCRTGYSGGRGYELVVPADEAVAVWERLVNADSGVEVTPAGLGARDTLRTEMGYPLHGQDISLEISPVQARASWAVGWDKPAFWGRDALTAERAAKPRRSLRGLVAAGRGIPRPHMAVATVDGHQLGEVTSGTFSPTRKQGIALALIDTAAGIADGDTVTVDVRGRSEPFVVTKPPFVTPTVK